MTNHTEQRTGTAPGIILGGILVLVGFFFIVMQIFNFSFAIGSTLWPIFIIVPGLFLFGMALTKSGKDGERFANVGSIVTMVGLLLLYQNSTDHWENWAYAWALIVPTAMGVGQMVYGSMKHEPELVKSGARLSVIGAVIFLAGFFFFEVMIGMGGYALSRFGIARYGLPVLLIGAGGLLIVYNLLANRGSQPPHQGLVQ
jgi:hypothetical protein